jgi:hypothetical protein
MFVLVSSSARGKGEIEMYPQEGPQEAVLAYGLPIEL